MSYRDKDVQAVKRKMLAEAEQIRKNATLYESVGQELRDQSFANAAELREMATKLESEAYRLVEAVRKAEEEFAPINWGHKVEVREGRTDANL
jgi:hypothetical protein